MDKEVELTKQKEQETERLIAKEQQKQNQVPNKVINTETGDIEQDVITTLKNQKQDKTEPAQNNGDDILHKKKGLMGSWIWLSILACLTFTLCNLTIAEISALGVEGMYFYNSGALVTCIIYFSVQHFMKRRQQRERALLDQQDQESRYEERSLLYNFDGTFDKPMIPLLIGGVLVQAVILYGITISYQYSIKAGLNIGISQTIWALTPFLTASIDYCVNGDRLEIHHYLGMAFICACAALVSVSSIIAGDETANLSIPVEERVATYVPILIAFFMPFASTAIILLSKHVCSVRGVSGNDWTFGYFFIFMFILQIMSIVYWQTNEDSFDSRLYWIGFVGSSLNVIGCFFSNSACGTGGPSGPISALVNTQMITVALMQILITLKIPHWVQIVGMLFGLLGAFVLTIPTQMHSLWYRMTRCRCQSPPVPYIPGTK